MRSKTIEVTLLVIFLFCTNTCLAVPNQIISKGTYLTDSISKLDWLDIIETNGQTLAEVTNRINQNGDLFGWRFATRFEFAQLTMADALVGNPGFAYAASDSAGQYWTNLSTYMYNTPAPYQLGTPEFTRGITFGLKGYIADPSLGIILGLVFKEDYDVIRFARPDYAPNVSVDGFYLVRSQIVEPSTIVLLFIGLAALFSFRYKLKR